MKKVLLVFFVFSHIAMASPFEPSVFAPDLVARAQQSYLEGDFSAAMMALKSAFMNSKNDFVAQRNVLKLVAKIKGLHPQPKLELGWQLPKEIPSMKVAASRRFEDGQVTHQLIVSGEMASLDEIEDFQVLRYPDTIVLDKQKKIGRFQVTDESGHPDYNYRTQSTPFDISAGLYLIAFTTKTGSQVNGWFFLDEAANSTAQPQILNFDANPVFNTGTPTLSWVDFSSPQYKRESEDRTLSIWIGQPNADRGAWSFWTSNLNQRSVLIGSELPARSGWSKGPLANGDYYALLSFQEAQNFGPLRILRRSATVKHFSVKK